MFADFRGKSFNLVEIATDLSGSRNMYTTLSEAEKAIWNSGYNGELFRTMYSYYDVNNTDISFGGYYFESDIEDYELNKKVVIYAVQYLHNEYDIPIDAFKFKYTNRSIWVEIIPSVMGITPSYKLNEIFKEITKYLNKEIEYRTGVKNPFDLQVYSPRQLSRVVGSYLPASKRYVIELSYYELENNTHKYILNRAKTKKFAKITYPQNDDFFVSEGAKMLFNAYKNKIVSKHKRAKKEHYNSSRNPLIANCIKNFELLGVNEGQRNLALFYTSIFKRDQGVSMEDWLEEIPYFMRNFDRNKIDSIAKIKSTVKSAYKSIYKLSFKTLKENFPDYCEQAALYDGIENTDNFNIYRKQLSVLFDNNATKFLYKSMFIVNYNYFNKQEKEITKTALSQLKKLGLVEIKDGKIIPLCATGSFISVPNNFIDYVDEIETELPLFAAIIYSSYNSINLNPKVTLEAYAERLDKSLRTIQRNLKILKEKGFINNTKISFEPSEKPQENKVIVIDFKQILNKDVRPQTKVVTEEVKIEDVYVQEPKMVVNGDHICSLISQDSTSLNKNFISSTKLLAITRQICKMGASSS